jgi:hypothetical protein
MQVTPGLYALLQGILDYAGMFPPARLSLDQAIRNYAQYQIGPDAWLLSRFICPAAQLAELSLHIQLFDPTATLSISALGRISQSIEDFLAGLRETLDSIAAFRSDHAAVEAIELVLPPGIEPPDVFMRAAWLIESNNLRPLTPFYEIVLSGDWQRAIAETVMAIASHNASWKGVNCRSAGFKLRTGGVTADAFPTAEQVAFAITACRDAGVAMKFTAGLHHPLRRFDASVHTKMHGFLNVFDAGVLAHAHPLSPADVQAILEDEQPDHFCFDAGGLSWQDCRATLQQIEAARRNLVLSFGSCSFDEPRDDLHALGLL